MYSGNSVGTGSVVSATAAGEFDRLPETTLAFRFFALALVAACGVFLSSVLANPVPFFLGIFFGALCSIAQYLRMRKARGTADGQQEFAFAAMPRHAVGKRGEHCLQQRVISSAFAIAARNQTPQLIVDTFGLRLPFGFDKSEQVGGVPGAPAFTGAQHCCDSTAFFGNSAGGGFED